MRCAITYVVIGSVLLGGCTAELSPSDSPEEGTLLIFHNSSGPMCLAALDWLEGVKAANAELVIEEHLTYEAGETELLGELEARFSVSQGVSVSFEYLPVIFYEEHVFSGFNDDVAEALEGILPSARNEVQ